MKKYSIIDLISCQFIYVKITDNSYYYFYLNSELSGFSSEGMKNASGYFCTFSIEEAEHIFKILKNTIAEFTKSDIENYFDREVTSINEFDIIEI